MRRSGSGWSVRTSSLVRGSVLSRRASVAELVVSVEDAPEAGPDNGSTAGAGGVVVGLGKAGGPGGPAEARGAGALEVAALDLGASFAGGAGRGQFQRRLGPPGAR